MVKGIAVTVLVTAVAVAGISQHFWTGKKRAMIDGMTERRLSQFEALAATHSAVAFVGDSITEGGLWSEWLPGVDVINRGISGNTTQDILDRMHQIVSVQPDKLFLMIGVNDLNKRLGAAVALANYTKQTTLPLSVRTTVWGRSIVHYRLISPDRYVLTLYAAKFILASVVN